MGYLDKGSKFLTAKSGHGQCTVRAFSSDDSGGNNNDKRLGAQSYVFLQGSLIRPFRREVLEVIRRARVDRRFRPVGESVDTGQVPLPTTPSSRVREPFVGLPGPLSPGVCLGLLEGPERGGGVPVFRLTVFHTKAIDGHLGGSGN